MSLAPPQDLLGLNKYVMDEEMVMIRCKWTGQSEDLLSPGSKPVKCCGSKPVKGREVCPEQNSRSWVGGHGRNYWSVGSTSIVLPTSLNTPPREERSRLEEGTLAPPLLLCDSRGAGFPLPGHLFASGLLVSLRKS